MWPFQADEKIHDMHLQLKLHRHCSEEFGLRDGTLYGFNIGHFSCAILNGRCLSFEERYQRRKLFLEEQAWPFEN